jgi:hypothetical protein
MRRGGLMSRWSFLLGFFRDEILNKVQGADPKAGQILRFAQNDKL